MIYLFTKAADYAAERLGEGLVIIEREDHRGSIHREIWARSSTRGRPKFCPVCRRRRPAGSVMYRPLSNANHRPERICATHLEEDS